MFEQLIEAPETLVPFVFDGATVLGSPRETVAAALLRASILTLRRSPVSGAPRAPFCMMGVCYDCLVEVEGAGTRQACMIYPQPGMRISSLVERRGAHE